MTTRVRILVFDDVEVLDFAGPYEVFTTANWVHGRSQPDAPPLFEVVCVSNGGHAITARAGLKVVPEHSFGNCPPCDSISTSFVNAKAKRRQYKRTASEAYKFHG